MIFERTLNYSIYIYIYPYSVYFMMATGRSKVGWQVTLKLPDPVQLQSTASKSKQTLNKKLNLNP